MTDVETALGLQASQPANKGREQQLGSNFTGGLKDDRVTLNPTANSHLTSPTKGPDLMLFSIFNIFKVEILVKVWQAII